MADADQLQSTAYYSYSQTGEDRIVKSIFDALAIPLPLYIDIGAHHPIHLSNTALFSAAGAVGINVEPDPGLFSHFPQLRPRDINLQAGVAAEAGQLTLYRMSASSLNTCSLEEAERFVREFGFQILEQRTIPVLTLTNLIEGYLGGRSPDFLSLDAEGFDDQILRSLDYSKHQPLVICVETLTYSESGNGIKDQDLINFLSANGYLVYADTHINTIFVRRDRWVNRTRP